MSDGTRAKRNEGNYKQTRMGDFFSKSSDNSKKNSKQGGSGNQSKVKKGSQTVGKKPVLDVKKETSDSKKGKADSKKKSEDSIKKPVEPVGRRNLKRKVTGAGMFHSVWTRGAQRDTEDYRNEYPGKKEYPNYCDNLDFYMNEIPSKPDGDYIDNIHADWWGDYDRLEIHHGYIQWLFPIRESGLNWHAQELQLHEIDKLRKSKKAMKRILLSYKMMLDFYGMKLVDNKTGKIERAENWRERFLHLNRSFHNYLRITRILKCLGEFGYENVKANFVKFVLHEGMEEHTLPNLIDSCVKYWIGVLRDETERYEVFELYEKLHEQLEPEEDTWSNKFSNSKFSSIVASGNSSSGKKTGKSHTVPYKAAYKKKSAKKSDDEFSDDDGTLEYAMSLIDSPAENSDDDDKGSSKRAKKGGKKAHKDHELSDSDDNKDFNTPNETPEAMEESQEMKFWSNSGKKEAKVKTGNSVTDHGLGSDEVDGDDDMEKETDVKGSEVSKPQMKVDSDDKLCENPLPESGDENPISELGDENPISELGDNKGDAEVTKECDTEVTKEASGEKEDDTNTTVNQANDSEMTNNGEQLPQNIENSASNSAAKPDDIIGNSDSETRDTANNKHDAKEEDNGEERNPIGEKMDIN